MTVNVLIITHDNVGAALLDAAVNTLGFCPLMADVIPISANCNPDDAKIIAREKAAALAHNSDGVLILTDIYGSTPSNIATSLIQEVNVRVISGINLPMIIRVLNYPQLDLDELVEKAISGGKEGIMDCRQMVD